MKKIWITGAEGHIGTALLDLLEGVEYQLLPTDIEEVDITKIDEVTQFVHVNRPDVVINCAGLTDVQECENNVDEAYRVNAIGVRNVALAANEVNAKVIQISTDDVFDKESRVPYNEFDNVHPRTIYGKSKEAGEKILTQLLNRFVIIRSSWLKDDQHTGDCNHTQLLTDPQDRIHPQNCCNNQKNTDKHDTF